MSPELQILVDKMMSIINSPNAQSILLKQLRMYKWDNNSKRTSINFHLNMTNQQFERLKNLKNYVSHKNIFTISKESLGCFYCKNLIEGGRCCRIITRPNIIRFAKQNIKCRYKEVK